MEQPSVDRVLKLQFVRPIGHDVMERPVHGPLQLVWTVPADDQLGRQLGLLMAGMARLVSSGACEWVDVIDPELAQTMHIQQNGTGGLTVSLGTRFTPGGSAPTQEDQ